MTNNIISLSDFSKDNIPSLTGPAICIQCKYKWTAVAPAGVYLLECPECGLEKGVWEYPMKTETLWTCLCGNDFFRINEDGIFCGLCGSTQHITKGK